MVRGVHVAGGVQIRCLQLARGPTRAAVSVLHAKLGVALVAVVGGGRRAGPRAGGRRDAVRRAVGRRVGRAHRGDAGGGGVGVADEGFGAAAAGPDPVAHLEVAGLHRARQALGRPGRCKLARR